MIKALYEKTGVLLEDAEHRNLLPTWPGRENGSSAFPLEHARARARRFRIRSDVATVIVLGWRLAQAFDLEPSRCFDPVLRNGRRWFVIPHLSDVNWWCDLDNRVRAMKFLEAL